jgi:hypothetical protein
MELTFTYIDKAGSLSQESLQAQLTHPQLGQVANALHPPLPFGAGTTCSLIGNWCPHLGHITFLPTLSAWSIFLFKLFLKVVGTAERSDKFQISHLLLPISGV